MKGFTLICAGQMFSLLGTALTEFALPIWAWYLTGQATALALMSFFNLVPFLLTTPLAGAIVDRSSRRKVMIRADLAAGLPTMGMLLLNVAGALQVWQVYIATAFTGVFQAFHFPAYSAAVTMMLPKEQYGRASGMLATTQFVSGVFGPVVAAILMSSIGLSAVMIIDILTLTLAISTLLFVDIPQPSRSETGNEGIKNIWRESFSGFHYIFERSSLLGLQLILFLSNLLSSFGNTLFTPMILARTENNALLLGTVMSFGGIGGVVGSVVLTIWGGPKRRIIGVLGGDILINLLGWFLVGLGRNGYVWSLAAFLGFFFLPILNGSSQAIWQSKVAPELQGRVFAARLFIAQMAMPLGTLLAGPSADNLFEPAMMPDGGLAATFGGLVGTGPGAGMSLMLVIAGFLGIVAGLGRTAFE